MNKTESYRVNLEVAGPLAMFARPDTGVTPTSYAAPTWSACKGIFESIARFASGDAWICPTAVEICKKRGQKRGVVEFERYTTNYGGPLRKSKEIQGGASFQLFSTILVDVCYRLHGEIRSLAHKDKLRHTHHLFDVFHRRLQKGQCYVTPSLGWREFTCSYWGPFREDAYEVDEELNLTIPSMLHCVWSDAIDGRYAPSFTQNMRVEKGVLVFDQ